MYHLTNDSQTQQLGEEIAKLSQPGDIYVLTGDLGAGKTTFSKGFAKGLGIQQMIKSPTYTLIREYDSGRFPLYHMDVYRLEGSGDDLGLDEYLEGDGICLIEWGEIIKENIEEDYIEILLNKTPEDTRMVTLKHVGADDRVKQITQVLEKGFSK